MLVSLGAFIISEFIVQMFGLVAGVRGSHMLMLSVQFEVLSWQSRIVAEVSVRR
jgi:hypothetical protein